MPEPSPTDPPQRPATLLEVVGVVFSSFLGLRKGQALRKVVVRPQQVIVVGIALAAVFVLTLVMLVRLIIRMAGA